jgi:dephospho-CoA kinase
MIIIGITGTIGAGKGTIVDYLIEQYVFAHFSVRKYLTERLTLEGKHVNRDTMTELANRLRSEHHSPSYIIEELYKMAAMSNQHCIIESIRTVGEIEKLKSIGNFYLLAVDADRAIRYDRIWMRKSETDRISLETFIDNENREMENKDPNKQNLAGCIALADCVLTNNTDVTTLEAQVNNFMTQNVFNDRATIL